MADRPAIRNPRVHVIMADGAEWTVQTVNQDMLRWENTAPKHKWPAFTETPQKWTTFLGWAASKREGLIPADLTWEEFSENGPRVALSVITNDDAAAVDPTRPAAGTG